VGADLTQYTYDRFAEDLEHVRRALGYGPLNLFAGSYGTRAAQATCECSRKACGRSTWEALIRLI
jgi:pimeloyl-ACP methyl ester carboxylesterase